MTRISREVEAEYEIIMDDVIEFIGECDESEKEEIRRELGSGTYIEEVPEAENATEEAIFACFAEAMKLYRSSGRYKNVKIIVEE